MTLTLLVAGSGCSWVLTPVDAFDAGVASFGDGDGDDLVGDGDGHATPDGGREGDGATGHDGGLETLPTVVITRPEEGEVFALGATLTFAGQAQDAEDGTLAGTALVWTLDGAPLGAGALVQTVVEVGEHLARLTATDTAGHTSFAEVSFVVDEDPVLPPPPVCGDAVVEGDEACDLGANLNVSHYDGCTGDCQDAPACPVEECQSCGANDQCAPVCDQGATCIYQCSEGADCQIDGRNNGTVLEVECAGTDRCDVKCEVQEAMSCSVSCTGGAVCELECISDEGTPYPCTCTADDDSTCQVQTRFD